jgi:hypothetical protein
MGTTKKSFRKISMRIKDLADKQGKVVSAPLRVIGEEIMTDVRATRPGMGVPKEWGDLMRSGRVTGPFSKGPSASVNLTFGGVAAPYALRQHEELTWNHPRGGEARYLVRAADRYDFDGGSAQKALQANMEAAIKASSKRGGKL